MVATIVRHLSCGVEKAGALAVAPAPFGKGGMQIIGKRITGVDTPRIGVVFIRLGKPPIQCDGLAKMENCFLNPPVCQQCAAEIQMSRGGRRLEPHGSLAASQRIVDAAEKMHRLTQILRPNRWPAHSAL